MCAVVPKSAYLCISVRKTAVALSSSLRALITMRWQKAYVSWNGTLLGRVVQLTQHKQWGIPVSEVQMKFLMQFYAISC